MRIVEADLLVNASLAFAIFSAIASAVYIFNDFLDIEEDRAHPVKKDRPLACRPDIHPGCPHARGGVAGCGPCGILVA